MVETRNLGVGQVMDNKRILDLPLNGRNPADLLQYLPASVPQVQVLASSIMGGSNGGQAYSLAGGLAFGVTYVLDGAMHNDPRNNLNLPLPFPDALQEFQAETSALTAQNGMHSGGAVNAVTKSGTNSFRGDALRVLPSSQLQRHRPVRDEEPRRIAQRRRVEAKPVRRHDRRADQDRPAVLLLRLPGDEHHGEPDGQPRVRADGGDAGGRLHGVRLAGVQRRRAAQPRRAVRRQPGRARRCSARRRSTSPPGCRRRPIRAASCSTVCRARPTKGSTSPRSTTPSAPSTRCSAATSRPRSSRRRRSRLESAQQNVLVTRIGGRDNKAQSFTLGENYVISPTTLNAVRFAYNRTDISRPNINFFSAPEVGINTYSYMPHYMLLTVTGGFTLGDRHRDADRHRHALLADQRRPDARARRPSVRVRRELRAAGARCRTATSGRQASSPSTARMTGLGLADFLLGRMGTNGAGPGGAEHARHGAEVRRAVRAGHLESRAAR